jgi:peroxiredoxin Q/BCP
MKRQALFIASLLLALPLMNAQPVQAELSVGDDVPKMTMRGSDGKDYNLADFKGKKAFVIAWYPKAFTGG